MENMLLNFLSASKKHIKNLSQFKLVSVVLGNETCDLDSAVSSFVYGLLLNHKKVSNSIVIPVLNIPRIELPVKTEVTYLLNKYNIGVESIVCRDEIDLEALHAAGCMQLTLLDHHAMAEADRQLAPSVVAVLDHRPQDPAWTWSHTDLMLANVGSCCTLVAERLLDEAPQLISPTVAFWLLGTILVDTACLSEAAGRATPRDHQMADQMQARCAPQLDRQQLFNELQSAKADISSLSAGQLLVKDLKMAAGIPISALPIKVKEFLKREDTSSALRQFCGERCIEVCLIYGQNIEKGTISRDIAVFSMNDTKLGCQIVEAMTASKEPFLNLSPQSCNVKGFQLFEQLNTKATRKQVLPIIRQVGENLQTR